MPLNVRGVQWFLGFANFSWCFIKGFFNLVIPLMFLLKKEAKVSWSIDIQVAFGCLEKGIHFSPILTQLDPTSVFIVEIDPLDFTVGIVLSQFSQVLTSCSIPVLPSLGNRLLQRKIMTYGTGSSWPSGLPFEEWHYLLEGAEVRV